MHACTHVCNMQCGGVLRGVVIGDVLHHHTCVCSAQLCYVCLSVYDAMLRHVMRCCCISCSALCHVNAYVNAHAKGNLKFSVNDTPMLLYIVVLSVIVSLQGDHDSRRACATRHGGLENTTRLRLEEQL